MSIFVTCLSSVSLEEMRAKIADAKERYQDILKYFWISEGRQAAQFDRQDAARYDFTANSAFLIQWNKEGGSEFIPQIPNIMYEVFGRDKLLVFDLNNEVIW
jgi:hypothetical protein